MRIKDIVERGLIMPQTIKPLGLIHLPGKGPNNRFGFRNHSNNRANEFDEARGSCWHGYQQKGYKKKGNKMVPNCVKEEAAGVGIVTKQNATKDVPVGGEYMNVKKLSLGKGKPKTLEEEFAEFLENIDPKVWTELRAKGLVKPMEYDSPEARAAYKAQGLPYKPDISIITKHNMDTLSPARKKMLKPIRVSDQEWIKFMNHWWQNERRKPEARDKVQQIKNAYKLLYKKDMVENFADGKRKGKSRPGRVKRAGASCKGSVTSLRAKAKKSSGERAKMYHWCANMKSGRKKSK